MKLLINKYLDKIKLYLKNINNLKKYDTCEVQLTIAINLISSKDTDEERAMHSKSDNIEIMIHGKADEVNKEIFESFVKRFPIQLETSTKGPDFIFDCVNLLHYICHKINLNHSRSYIYSPNWIKNEKKKMKPINDDDK